MKRQSLFHWSKDNRIDILCLQETFSTKDNCSSVYNDWEGETYHSLSDSSHSRGVSILIWSGFEYNFLSCNRSQDGRRIILNIECDNEILCIVSVYAPNQEQNRIDFFKKLICWIDQHSSNDNGIILCGDFNCAIESIDRNTNTSDRSRLHLKNLVTKLMFLIAID